MSYAVINAQGKQYKVMPKAILEIDKIDGEKGSKISFSEVLLHVDGDKISVGNPFVKDVQVKATIVDQIRGEKIKVAKFKAKARERRITGFRAELTKIKIEEFGVKKAAPKK